MASLSLMAVLPIIGSVWPTYVSSEGRVREIETETIIEGQTLPFTYTNSVLKKVNDQQTAIDAKTPART